MANKKENKANLPYDFTPKECGSIEILNGSIIAGGPPITPHGDRLVIKADSPEKVTASGIIIPEMAVEKPQTGTVVATGLGRVIQSTGDLIPMQTKIGDRVIYGKNTGTEVILDGQEYLIVREPDIYAIL